MLLQDHFLLSLKGHGDCGEVHEDWKKENDTAIFKKAKKKESRELQTGQLHFSPWKGDIPDLSP